MKWSAARLGGHMLRLRMRLGEKVCHAEINSLTFPTTADNLITPKADNQSHG
jgi:hypothetical protein